MDGIYLVWAMGGAIVVLIGMLVVVIIARSMDRAAPALAAPEPAQTGRKPSADRRASRRHAGHGHADRIVAAKPTGLSALIAHDPALSAIVNAAKQASSKADPKARKKANKTAGAIIAAVVMIVGALAAIFDDDDDDDRDDRRASFSETQR